MGYPSELAVIAGHLTSAFKQLFNPHDEGCIDCSSEMTLDRLLSFHHRGHHKVALASLGDSLDAIL
jgi:hypothetical protein